jgi:hypothetical protein
MPKSQSKKTSTQNRQDSDSPWKKILRHYFPQAIAFFFPEVSRLIDWSRPYQFLDKEFEQIAPKALQGKRYADKLVRVWRLDGKREYLLIHLEIQARKEEGFPKRMLVYCLRIFDRYGYLPTSLAILCDNNPAWRPERCELVSPMTDLSFGFGSVKLLDYAQDWEALEQSDNPFAWIIMAHLKTQATKHNLKSRKSWKFSLMRQLYERGMAAQDIRNLYEFIDWTMILGEELEDEFWQELKSFEESQKMPYVTNAERIGIQKGIKQGIEQGIELRNRSLAMKLLQRGMSLDEVSEVTELSIGQLQKLQSEIDRPDTQA